MVEDSKYTHGYVPEESQTVFKFQTTQNSDTSSKYIIKANLILTNI